MKRQIVTVIHGPSVWVGQRGWLLALTPTEVVGRFWARDDAGSGVYDVRFPKDCVKVEDEPDPVPPAAP